MNLRTHLTTIACAALLGGVLAAAQQAPPAGTPLPLEPSKERGSSITPAYEGWFANPDGSFSILLGYFNRNRLSHRVQQDQEPGMENACTSG